MAETKRNMLDCDGIFAWYLRDVAYHLNSSYYAQNMLPFILMFRDCLNTYGWEKRIDNECKDTI